MDFSWAEDVKKKFIAMANELDKSVAQDTAKYFEKQLQSAGGGLNKLYSNVQDLVAPCETDSVDQHVISDRNDVNKAESEVAPKELDSNLADQISDAAVQENVFTELHPECRLISLSSKNCPGISESDAPTEQNVNDLLNDNLDVSIDGSATKVLSHVSIELGSKYHGDNMIEMSTSSTNSVTDIDRDIKNGLVTPTPLDPVAANCLKDESSFEVCVVDHHVPPDSEDILEVVGPEVASGQLVKTLADKDADIQEFAVNEPHLKHQLTSLSYMNWPKISESGSLLEENVSTLLNEKSDVNINESVTEMLTQLSDAIRRDQISDATFQENVFSEPHLECQLIGLSSKNCPGISKSDSPTEQNVNALLNDKLDVSIDESGPKVLSHVSRKLGSKYHGDNIIEMSASSTNSVRDIDRDIENRLVTSTPLDPVAANSLKDDSSCEVRVVDQHEDLLEDVNSEVASGQLDKNLAGKEADNEEIAVNEPHVEHQLLSFSSNNWPRISESDSQLGGNVNTLLNEKSDVSINESVTEKLTQLSEPLVSKHTGDDLIETSATGDFIEEFDCKYASKTLEEFVLPLPINGVDSQPLKDIDAERASILTRCSPVKNSDLPELLPDKCSLKSTQSGVHLEESGCANNRLVTGQLSLPDPAASSQNKLADITPNYYTSMRSSKSYDANASKVKSTGVQTELSRLKEYQLNEPAQIEALIASKHAGMAGRSDKSFKDLHVSRMETIDLNEKLKLDKSYVNPIDSEIYAAEKQIKKYRSYKERILDAFTYKRRIAKEYQKLPIWFGDTDFFPEHDTSHSLTQDRPSNSLDLKDQAKHDPSGFEWELI